MMLRWVGIALLGFSWLAGGALYRAASPVGWAVVTGLGIACLAGSIRRVPSRGSCFAALILFVPAAAWVATRMIPAAWQLATTLAPWAGWPEPGPVAWSLPAALVLGFVGLICFLSPLPERVRAWLGSTGLVACAVLLVQALVMFGYEVATSWSHDVPTPVAEFVALAARLLGMDAAADGAGHVALFSMRQTHKLAMTWDLLADPATLCFVAGGLCFIGLRVWSNQPRAGHGPSFWKPALTLAACAVVWLPIRAGLEMGVYLHRVLRTDYEARLQAADQFWNIWLMLGLVVVLAVASSRVVRVRGEFDAERRDPRWGRRWPRPIATLLVFLGSAALALAVFWAPSGERKGGRVMVDEYHSDWESTEHPFTTNWYGEEAAYNYACIYDYCSRFYSMSRLRAPLTADVLENVDVLVIKCPGNWVDDQWRWAGWTPRISPAEIDAVQDFVRRGGGLVVIGEHTNYRRMGTHLNDVTAGMGFTYRYDCLFDTGVKRTFSEQYAPGFVPHPIIQRMGPFTFEVGTSIAPGTSCGRTVIRGTRLKSMGSDWHAKNFYPQLRDEQRLHMPDSRYGAFTQLLASNYGRGRIVAWADSTVFSNFSTFEPGKSELMLGMLEWANRREPFAFDLRLMLLPSGAVLLLVGLLAARRWGSAWLVLMAAALAAWACAGAAAKADNAASLPPPEQIDALEYPLVKVTVDRTLCNSPLSEGGFIKSSLDGFGIFDRWILRLGYFTARCSGPDVFQGDVAVFLYPRREPSEQFVRELVKYVESGGKVLVIDSAANVRKVKEVKDSKGRVVGKVIEPEPAGKAPWRENKYVPFESTANRLLGPFGLSVGESEEPGGRRASVTSGKMLEAGGGLPAIPVITALEVRGGEPIARLDGKVVAATVRKGRGSVTVIGFGQRFTDSNMGVIGDVVPDKDLRKVFDFEFGLLRAIVEGKPPVIK